MKVRFQTLSLVIFAFIGLIIALLFQFNVVLPLRAGIGILTFLTVYGLIFVKTSNISVLPRLLIVLYSMPFSICLFYLFNDEYTWVKNPLAGAYIYAQNRLINEKMIMIGIVGLAGLITGIWVSMFTQKKKICSQALTLQKDIKKRKTLDPLSFLCFLGVSFYLSWLFAPPDTIFQSSYATTQGIATKLNFYGSFLISYIILLLLYIDSERERRKYIRRWKILLTLSTALFIVVFFQLLRGDRECMMLVGGLMALYLTGPDLSRAKEHFRRISTRLRSIERQRIRKLIVPSIAIFLVLVSLGELRNSLSTSSRAPFNVAVTFEKGLNHSTWTAILLTNLGMIVIYQNDPTLLYGNTYKDYFLSLPPGIVTKALGIKRPFDADTENSPSWWFKGIAAGGVHIVNVPFRNFGTIGAFLVLAFYGYLCAKIDVINNPNRFWNRLMYATVVCSSFFWFWYGDMNIIRGLMAAIMLGIFYRIFTNIDTLYHKNISNKQAGIRIRQVTENNR